MPLLSPFRSLRGEKNNYIFQVYLLQWRLDTMHWHITFGCMKIFYWCFVKWQVPLTIYFNICEKVVKVLVAQSHLTVTPWTVTWPAPLSMKFFRQEYWRGSCSSTPRNWAQVFCIATAAAAKSLQSCPTLCDPTDCSLPGFSIPGILQARTLEWVAISFSNAWKWKVKVKSFSHVWLLGTPWTAAYQAPPSVGFARQEYWSGVPLPSPFCIAGRLFTIWATREDPKYIWLFFLLCDHLTVFPIT